MKTKYTQEKAISTATLGVSAATGALASKGAMGIAPESFKKPIIRTALGLTALIAASVIQGNSTGATIGRGVTLGVGVQQVAEGIAGFVNPLLPASITAGVKPQEKFLAEALKGAEYEDVYASEQAWEEEGIQIKAI